MSLYFVITDEVTMVQWNHRQNFIHFLFAIVSVHILCWYFEFLQIIFDNPITSYRQQTDWLCNFTEQVVIYHNCSLSYLLLNLDFQSLYFFLCFDSCCGMLISKNIIFFLTLITWLTSIFIFWFLFKILFEHIIIVSNLSCNFLFIILYFSHKAQINKSIDLPLLILRPNILSWFILIKIFFRFLFWRVNMLFSVFLVYFMRLWLIRFTLSLSFISWLLFLVSFLSKVILEKSFLMRFQVLTLFYMPVS